MNDEINTDETKMELLKLINRTGIRVVLPNDLRNQVASLEARIKSLLLELNAREQELAPCPQSDMVRLEVLKKIHAINKFRFFQ